MAKNRKAIKYSIYFELTDNEFIWDSIYAFSVKDAIQTFKYIYQQIKGVKDEEVEKCIYINEDLQKAEWKDYLPSWQRSIK